MPVVDHTSRLVLGHARGEADNTELALDAWRMAMTILRRYGRKTEGLIIHHNQDGVYLDHGWLHELVVLDMARVSSSENGAKGNFHMESFNSRFKAENRLLFWEHNDLLSLNKVVGQRIRYYYHVRRYTALGYQSPIRYLKEKGQRPG